MTQFLNIDNCKEKCNALNYGSLFCRNLLCKRTDQIRDYFYILVPSSDGHIDDLFGFRRRISTKIILAAEPPLESIQNLTRMTSVPIFNKIKMFCFIYCYNTFTMRVSFFTYASFVNIMSSNDGKDIVLSKSSSKHSWPHSSAQVVMTNN